MSDEKLETKVLLSAAQVAKYLGVSKDRVFEWTHQQYQPLPYVALPGCTNRKYRKADVDAFIERYVVKGDSK